MARVLLVSFDASLLRSRELMLAAAGHAVTSAYGPNVSETCVRQDFDLAIIGHSIPTPDKREYIGAFRRANPGAAVIVLARRDSERPDEAEVCIDPADPEALLRAIEAITGRTVESPPRKTG